MYFPFCFLIGVGDKMCNIKTVICSQCSSLSNDHNHDLTFSEINQEEKLPDDKSKPNCSTKSSQTLFSNLDLNQNIIEIDNKNADKCVKSKRLLPYHSKFQRKKMNKWDPSETFTFNRSVQFGKYKYFNCPDVFIS